MDQEALLPQVLFFFGIGFFVANIKVIADLVRFRVRKASALLIWQGAKPRYYGFTLALGAILGALVAFKIFVLRIELSQQVPAAVLPKESSDLPVTF